MSGKIKNITTKCSIAQIGLTNNTYPVIGVPGIDLTAFKQTITADTNYVFKTPPSIDFSNVDDPNDYTVTITDTKNSNNVVIVRVFSIVYTPDVLQPSNDEIVFVSVAEPGYNPSTGNIYSYELNTNFLNSTGDSRALKMKGDAGAIITVKLWNVTPGFPHIDMLSEQYTFQANGTSLSYVRSGETYIVDQIEFAIPGLKYWRTPITDETIRVEFTVSGSNIILWDNDPVVNNTAEYVYLYQYRPSKVILQLSSGNALSSATKWRSPSVANFLQTNPFSSMRDIWNVGSNYVAGNLLVPSNWNKAAISGAAPPPGANDVATKIQLNATSISSGIFATYILTSLTGSPIIKEPLVIDNNNPVLYRLSFEIRVSAGVGANGILVKHHTSNSTYNDNFRGVGLNGTVYNPALQEGWQQVDLYFNPGTINGDVIQFINTSNALAQEIDLANFRLTRVKCVGTGVGNYGPGNAVSGISGVEFPATEAGTVANTLKNYPFKLTAYLAAQGKGVKYQNKTSAPADLVLPTGNRGISFSLAYSTVSNLVDVPPKEAFTAWRADYKLTNDDIVDSKGVVLPGSNNIGYEYGCTATILKPSVKVTNVANGAVAGTKFELSGTLQINTNPIAGDAVIEFNIESWFTEGGNLS